MDKIAISFPAPCPRRWEAMSRAGQDRFCAACATVVVDAEQRSAEEIDALLDGGEKVCVRARVGASGAVLTRSSLSAAKVVATVGTGLALMTSTPLAAKRAPDGTIVGKVTDNDWQTVATATSPDGRTYKAKVKSNGKYKIKHVPPGTYQMSYTAACAQPWNGTVVIVEAGTTVVANTQEAYDCIVVGLVERRDDDG